MLASELMPSKPVPLTVMGPDPKLPGTACSTPLVMTVPPE